MITSDRERQAPQSIAEAEPSHLVRYQFACQFLNQESIVLDVPCGSGYGVALMSEHAQVVYGVDIFAPAIEHAKELFSNERTKFLVSDGHNMQALFPDSGCFDIITSFEGIEHLQNPEQFLHELHRLLKPEGLLIISTPRKPHGSPYHIREFTLLEYTEILSSHFHIRSMNGQLFTDIFDMEERAVNPDIYPHFNFIAVCSKSNQAN